MENNQTACQVLLLDDDEDDYVLIKALLQESFEGRVKLDWYQKDHVSTLMVCSGMYALTMIDYRLGADSGLEAIRKAKAQCPDQKIILVTGMKNPTLIEKAIEYGADGYLDKDELSIIRIRELLGPLLC